MKIRKRHNAEKLDQPCEEWANTDAVRNVRSRVPAPAFAKELETLMAIFPFNGPQSQQKA